MVLGALFTAVSAMAGEREEKGNLNALRNKLAKDGFIVQDGILDFPKILDMCCQCELPSCFANNPSSPYALTILPPAPDQSPSVVNPFAEWFTEKGTYPAGWSWFWRLRPDEAVVLICTTPPEMKYFGFTAYLYDRFHPLPHLGPCTAPGISRDYPDSAQNRFPLFASLGDTVNNMTVRVNGNASKPFGRKVVFVLATDQNVKSKVRRALVAAGYPKSIINTVVIPYELTRMGVEGDKDSFAFVLRMATDQDLTDYIASPKTLLRISPATPVPAASLDPIPLPKLRVRGVGKTETSLLSAVDKLGQAIIAAYPDYNYTAIHMTNWNEGYNCIENTQNCLGDNRDTPYIPPSFNPANPGLIDDMVLNQGEFFVAYGVNHTTTKKAVYSNIAVLGWNHKASPAVIDDSQMPGSARAYLGSSMDAATEDMLYAWKIARPAGCTPGDTPFCREIDDSCTGGVAMDEPMAIVFRAYLESSTKVGAAYGEIIIDRVLKFTPKTQQPDGLGETSK